MTDLIKDFIYSDFADALFVLKLKQQMEDSFNSLDDMATKNPVPDYLWTDYADNIQMVRSCITILQWYEGFSFDKELARVNKHSLKFAELF